jgi:hypothetical protein
VNEFLFLLVNPTPVVLKEMVGEKLTPFHHIKTSELIKRDRRIMRSPPLTFLIITSVYASHENDLKGI